ncbi:hypothetical protein [Paucibacter sp. M5-1]|uniref:hypothetical protein n=1 Tax=Paucibacter sp. M5-1 TaxID=3015998 RepID=UPI0022B8C01A|nr:hypothetical protein [Paucibacter sp. M5-1]MCZ7882884.1 hypothetical protein [Paucibacter sp. M5-1]
MSAAPQTIARKSPQQQQTPGGPALDFEALRSAGIALAQAASGQLWTDYNLHDPGVTLLEALCYALTEDVYGAQQSVPELLGWPEGQVLPERHGLHQPERILPCRPITAADYRRALLARCPGALQLRLQPCEQRLPGLWRLALLAQESQIDAAQRAFWSLRNLGEDLDGAVRRLQPRPHRLAFEIDVQGPRELAELLGEIAQRAADFIAARPRWRPADTALDPALRFDGPALPQGWISDAELQRGEQSLLYFSDLVLALQGIEGLASVRRLQLLGEGDGAAEPDADAVPWGDEAGALCLQWPRRAEDLMDWVVWRGTARETLPEQNLLRRLAQLQVAHEHPLPGLSQATLGTAVAEVAPPEHPPYYPALLQLPAIYAHPESLGEQRHRSHSRAGQHAQWLAYTALLEQWLAHGQAQRQRLGALYSLAIEAAPSYWWQPLGESHLEGLTALQLQTPAEQLTALQAEDDALERRGRVLDQLLALHGEALPQSGLRGLPCYFSPGGFEQHLLRLKQTLAAGIERFTRERHAGFDYSRPSFGLIGNTAPLQERLSLQLGFAEHHSRSLTAPLRERGLSVSEDTEPPKVLRQPGPGLRPMQLFADAPRREDLADKPLWKPGDRLDPALLRCAVHASRYQWQEQSKLLWLGPDEQQRWWPLGRQADAAAAQDLALALHGFACGLQLRCEGLHLLEHLLLRPQGEVPLPPDVPDDFYAQQLSVVLPAWTARGADPRFRTLAARTVAELAPAHLQTHCLWLQAEALQAFELALQGWLLAKRALCEGLAGDDSGVQDPAAQRRLDSRAAVLRRLLWQQISGEAPP